MKPQPTYGHRWIAAMQGRVWALAVILFSQAITGTASDTDAAVQSLKTIVLDDSSSALDRAAAEALQVKLKERHALVLKIVRWSETAHGPASHPDCIFVGRTAAVKAGMIANDELDAVKYDGYVLRAANGRIALAGYGGRGTMYAVRPNSAILACCG